MEILLCTLRAISVTLTDPFYIIILIMISLMLYSQNRKTSAMQKMIIGEKINSAFELTISQIVLGIFGGVAVSLITSYLGIIFREDSMIYIIFLISIVLMMWSPRLVCFSYSGSALGIASVILSTVAWYLNKPELDMLKIDIKALMILIAVLHFVEGLMVILDGKRGAIPVFSSRDNKIVGGFAMKRYWVFPVAIFLLINDKTLFDLGTSIDMPSWWPLISTTIPAELLKVAAVTLMPFYGIIGYSSITFTKDKEQKTANSGVLISIYGVVLFGLAQLVNLNFFIKIFVLIFAPIAHELMLNYQTHLEIKKEPRFISTDEGLMVLDVAPNSPAKKLGIKTGDLIMEINGEKVQNEIIFKELLTKVIKNISLKIKNPNGKVQDLVYSDMDNSKRLGVVIVPRGIPDESVIVDLKESKFRDMVDKLKKNEQEENFDKENYDKEVYDKKDKDKEDKDKDKEDKDKDKDKQK